MASQASSAGGSGPGHGRRGGICRRRGQKTGAASFGSRLLGGFGGVFVHTACLRDNWNALLLGLRCSDGWPMDGEQCSDRHHVRRHAVARDPRTTCGRVVPGLRSPIFQPSRPPRTREENIHRQRLHSTPQPPSPSPSLRALLPSTLAAPVAAVSPAIRACCTCQPRRRRTVLAPPVPPPQLSTAQSRRRRLDR